MYILVNAMKNLERNKGRNILIAAVTLAIIVCTVVTLTINNAAAKVIDDIRLDLGSRVEIRQDFIEMREMGMDGRTDANYVSMENFYSFADSEYLSKTVWSANMYAHSDTFFAVDDALKGTGTRTCDDGEVVLVETLKLTSTSETNALSDFGEYREIVEGRMYENLNECIISQEIAQLNNVTIGDVIALRGTFTPDKVFNLTVSGIYSDTTEEYTNIMFAMNGRFADNRRNEVITSWETLMAADWQTNLGLDMKTEFFLKNPDDIGEFEQEVRSKGLPVTYNVSINQAAYEKVTGPLSSMKSAVVTFMVVILILGAIVLALISFFAVRERKYEVGVLRAMGMEKSKVAFGILSETVMIAVLCLAIGLGAGSLMAQPVADNILKDKVAAVEADSGGKRNLVLFSGGQMQTNDSAAGYEPESEIQVSLSKETIMQITLITVALAALSGIIGVMIITQYESLKILRERN